MALKGCPVLYISPRKKDRRTALGRPFPGLICFTRRICFRTGSDSNRALKHLLVLLALVRVQAGVCIAQRKMYTVYAGSFVYPQTGRYRCEWNADLSGGGPNGRV